MKRSASRYRAFALGLCLLSSLATAGCSTYADRIRLAHTQFYMGDLEPAAETLTEYIQRIPAMPTPRLGPGHRPVSEWKTGRGRADVARRAGQPRRIGANDALESGLSMLTDDQRLAYSGTELRKGPDARLSGADQSPERRTGRGGL